MADSEKIVAVFIDGDDIANLTEEDSGNTSGLTALLEVKGYDLQLSVRAGENQLLGDKRFPLHSLGLTEAEPAMTLAAATSELLAILPPYREGEAGAVEVATAKAAVQNMRHPFYGLLPRIIAVLHEVLTHLPDATAEGSWDAASAKQLRTLLDELAGVPQRQQTIFTVPTYHPNQPTGTEEYGDPHRQVAVVQADGLKIVLGTHDWQDTEFPDVQVERRHGGWAIFLHPVPGGDAAGYVYYFDDGRIFFQPETFAEIETIEASAELPEGFDLPEDPEPPAGPKSHWTEDPEYPVKTWQYEVANDDTRLGYAEWVADRKEQAEEP